MIALILTVSLAAAASAAPTWTVEADTSTTAVQETRIVYRTSSSVPGLEPDVLASATTTFAIVSVVADKNGSAWTWTVLPLDAGRLAFTAKWKVAGEPASAAPVIFDVRSPNLAKDADISDIKGPLAARRALWPWLLTLFIGAAAWEIWRRWKARPMAALISKAVPPIPAEIAAESALTALAASGLWEKKEYAQYYLRLTEILRVYLEARYLEPATAMTSAEVSRLVRGHAPNLAVSASIRDLLSRADLVKFARIVPQYDDGAQDAGRVAELVRTTTPVPAAATEAAP